MGFGRLLIILGLVILAIGVVVAGGERLSIFFGKLPADLTWRGKNTVVYFPIVSCVVLSVVLSLIVSFFGRR